MTDTEHGTEVKKHCRSDLVLRYKHLLLEDFSLFYTSLVGITTLYNWYSVAADHFNHFHSNK